VLDEIARRYPDRSHATVADPWLPVRVDPPLARFSAWYEFFPRSVPGRQSAHGTFADCERYLPRIAEMGFDVVYFPPIHPIGASRRKGRNNSVTSEPGEPGSPWAIGAEGGGHKAIHPGLGSAEDFRRLVHAARTLGIEIALDIAFQTSPDHPYVTEHPSWFRHRPDGSVQYAENPPKKYQDIYPFNFETEDWRGLWTELRDVFLHWISEGVRVFRVDNPHTKPFAMWEWLIGEVKAAHPDVLFLSEAFTRPKIMHRLSKLGFSQSYTYFTWRNSKAELTEYFTELALSPTREYFRPNVWPNTPDILHETLQRGGRPAFAARAVLAATLASSYGIYGPAFELFENAPLRPGSEEYLNSEKYEIRTWDVDRADSLRPLLTRLNQIRREHPALQHDWHLRFVDCDNDRVLCYAKTTPDRSSVIFTTVNLNPFATESTWVDLPLAELGLRHDEPFEIEDLLTGARYHWRGSRNFVQLRPGEIPAHVFRLPSAR
jgi:starch synthase (maltosyl-transferring)